MRQQNMNEDNHCIKKYGYAFDNVGPPPRFEPTTADTTKMYVYPGETTELDDVDISRAASSIVLSPMPVNSDMMSPMHVNSDMMISPVHVNSDMMISPVHTSSDETPCKNCNIWRTGRSTSEEHSESPWHVLKTVFLIFMIVVFVLWIIIYTLLEHYNIL